MPTVIITDEWEAWYDALDDQASEAVYEDVELLRREGVLLRFPHTSRVRGSRYAMRELRTQAGGRPLRSFYMFDRNRQAVVLLGGDKTGNDRFYEEMTPQADRRWEQYLNDVRKER